MKRSDSLRRQPLRAGRLTLTLEPITRERCNRIRTISDQES